MLTHAGEGADDEEQKYIMMEIIIIIYTTTATPTLTDCLFRLHYLMWRPLIKRVTRSRASRAQRRLLHACAITLQTAARGRWCRCMMRRLVQQRACVTAAAAADFRPTPEMVAAGESIGLCV